MCLSLRLNVRHNNTSTYNYVADLPRMFCSEDALSIVDRLTRNSLTYNMPRINTKNHTNHLIAKDIKARLKTKPIAVQH